MVTSSSRAVSSRAPRLIAGLLALALACFIGLAGCSSNNASSGSNSGSSSSSAQNAPAELVIPVTVSSSAEDNAFTENYDVTLEEGATALDALLATGLEVEHNNGFVTSVAGLANGDYGEMSGWTFTIDDATPDPYVGASEFTLEEGMTVQWTYITDFGEM